MSLAPNYEKAYKYVEDKIKADGKEDSTNQTPDKPKQEPIKRYKASSYPLVVWSYEEREGSIYGIGEVQGLINNQKTVNNILAMQAYSTEYNAFGKLVVKGDALGKQVINNKPAQILYDYSKTSTQGIYRLPDPQLSDMPLREIESIMSLSRSVTGSTEVLSGEVIGKNMSGQAIAQLQSQAMLPTEEKRQRLQDSKFKQGKVMEMFFRTHYDEDREFTYTDQEFDAQENKTKEVIKSDVFNATQYTDEMFDITVEVSAGTRSSVSGDIAMLDLALQTKAIDFNTYLKLYPTDALSDKSKLLEELENLKNDELTVLRQQNAQYESQVLKLTEAVAKQDGVVQKAVQCIKGYESLQQLAVKQNAEFAQKIQLANQQIKSGNQMQERMFNDSKDMFNQMWGLMSEEERAKAMAQLQGNQGE